MKLKRLFLYQLSHKFGHRVISQKVRMGKTARDHSGSWSATSLLQQGYPRAHGTALCPNGSVVSPLREAPHLSGQPVPLCGDFGDEHFSNTWTSLRPCWPLSVSQIKSNIKEHSFLIKILYIPYFATLRRHGQSSLPSGTPGHPRFP